MTNKLPKEWLEGGIWRKKAILTLFRWAGTQENPWIITDEKIASALSKICDAYFGDMTDYTMTANCGVVCIVSTVHI